ncbi:MAG: DUF3267 domain-containing protein [Bacteroidia bacterium]|nr:DUF3267 domain-containing protein [Bacteroidia bacterium]
MKKAFIMVLKVEDFEDQTRYRQILAIPYSELITFVLDYIKRKSGLMVFFWSVCIIFLGMALTVRINIAGYFLMRNILFHSVLGLVIFPVLCIPVHESLHIIPYYLTGARKIRIGMDLKQFMFYVTAHRHVATSIQFRIVALVPFIAISVALTLLIFILPWLWKWSLSLFLFVHTTMCAGDFAMLNFYFLNRDKKIYTWDDADQKMAYFYEKL